MRKALLIIILINIIRFVVLPFTGLMPQEAYFAFYAGHPAFSYFDHPPMIGYFLYAFILIGGKNAFTIKLMAFIITLLSQLAFFKFSGLILRGNRKYLAWILYSTTIMVTSLSFVSCPDVLLVLFWTLSLWMLYLGIFKDKWWGWILSGIFMGLAFNSKYPAVSIPSGMFLFLIFSNKYRKLLGTLWPYVALIITSLATIPVFYWNAQNQFISLGLNSLERAEPFDAFRPDNILIMSSVQLFLLMPVIFIGLWWVMFKYFGRIFKKPNQVNAELWFLLCFFLPVFMGLYMVSIFGEVKYNWLLPTYISGIILLSRFLKYRWLKWHLGFAVVFQLVLIYYLVNTPNRFINEDSGTGWKQLAQQVDSIHKDHSSSFIFSADTYKTTAELSFFLNDTIYGPEIIGLSPYAFGFIGLSTNELLHKNALFLLRVLPYQNSSSMYTKNLEPYFNKITEINPIIVKEKDKLVLEYRIFYCSDYKYNNLR